MQVEPSVTTREMKSISEGVEIDGKLVHPVAITLENGYLRIVVAEGKNREVIPHLVFMIICLCH